MNKLELLSNFLGKLNSTIYSIAGLVSIIAATIEASNSEISISSNTIVWTFVIVGLLLIATSVLINIDQRLKTIQESNGLISSP